MKVEGRYYWWVKTLTKAAVPLAAATRHAVFNGVSDLSVNNFWEDISGRPYWLPAAGPRGRMPSGRMAGERRHKLKYIR
jgi:hypothetical protein